MKIGLLFGGKSFEHDISIITAGLVYYALKDKYELYPLYIDHNGGFYYVKDIEPETFKKSAKKPLFFVDGGFKCGLKRITLDVIIGCMHGLNGEDGLAAILCNLYHICYMGTNATSAGICLDKYYTYALLKANGIKALNSRVVTKDTPLTRLKFPLIIKPARLGSSIGIAVCQNEDELNEKLLTAFKYDERVVLQKYHLNAVEYNQAIYKMKGCHYVSKVECIFKQDDFYSFKDKYETHEKTRTFCEDEALKEKISTISKKIYELFNLNGIVRIDYLLIDDALYVNEINTTPGSLAYYLFTEDFKTLLENNLKESIISYNKRQSFYYPTTLLEHTTFVKK